MTRDEILKLAKAHGYYSDEAVEMNDIGLVAFARLVRDAALEEAINVVETYRVSVGNSRAGELAAEWTMENLREVRDELRALKENGKA